MFLNAFTYFYMFWAKKWSPDFWVFPNKVVDLYMLELICKHDWLANRLLGLQTGA